MKKLLLLFVMIMMAMTVMAQTTEKITYQAVVRDRTNRLVVYTPVRVDVTITYSSGSYFESLRDTTNANGLMYVLIGGNPGFENINWERAVIKTVITIEGGETVSDEVVVTAVPIALQANYATNVSPTAPTIVAVYNQMQADSMALANRIAAERAHLDDTLSHYLMQEVQVLSISNDTIYLTGGSFVKLPAGFSGNYNDLTNKPNLDQYATNVHLNDTLGHYLMQEVQVLSVSNDTLYLTGGSWVKLPQGFSGDYNDLTNKPDLNQYATNVHLNDTLSHYLMQEVQVLSVSNDTLYLTGGSWVKLPQGFSGDYNDLTNKPNLDQYATNVHLNDTLSQYTTTNKIDTLLGAYATNTHLNDTLGHYLMQEVQVLSVSNDTLYLTGGSWVKLPQGFSGDYNDLTNKPNLDQYATNVHLNDTLSQYTTTNKIDTLLGAYATNAHLNDTLGHYLMQEVQIISISNDTIYLTGGSFVKLPAGFSGDYNDLTNKPDLDQYATNVHLNDTLSQYTTTNKIDTLLGAYATNAHLNDTLSRYTTTNKIDTLLGAYATNAHLNDTLKSYTTTDQIDTLLDKHHYLTSDSAVIVTMRDSIQKVNDRLTYDSTKLADRIHTDSIALVNRIVTDSTVLAHRMDTLLKHVCDSVKPCVTELINDTLKAYTTSNKIDTLLGAYATNAHLNDTLKAYTTTNKIDTLLGAYATNAHLNDTLKAYTTTNKIDTLLGAYATNAHLNDTLSHYYDTTLMKKAIHDTANVLRGEFPVVNDGQITIKVNNQGVEEVNTFGVNQANDQLITITIPAEVAVNNGQLTIIAKDDTTRFTANQAINDTVDLSGFATISLLNDTLKAYTTSNKIDTLLGAYATNAHLNDTLKSYTTTNKIDTLLGAYATNAHLNDTLKAYTTTNKIDTLLGAYATNAHLNDTLSRYTTTDKIDTLLDKHHYLTSDSAVIVTMRDSIQKVNNRLTYDSTALAHRMDTLLKHVCDSVKPCVTGWMGDTLQAYTTSNKIDTLLGAYATNAHLNDTLKSYTTTNKIDTLLGAYATNAHLNDTLKSYTTTNKIDSLLGAYATNAHLNDTLKSYTTTNKIDTLLGAYATNVHLNDTLNHYTTTDQIDTLLNKHHYLTSDSTVIVTMRDSIQKVNAHVSADSLVLATRMDTLLKHVCDSVKPCVTGWMGDTLQAYTTSNKIDTLLGAYTTDAHLNDTLSRYTTTNKIDTLLGAYATNAHLNDTLSHYLMQEVQVLSVSNDTLYLTGGSWVKLPQGFSGDYNDLTNKPDLDQYATNVHLNDTLSQYTTTNKIDTLLGAYTTNAHLNDTLGHYTTTDQIDTLLDKHHYLTSDSIVIVTMRDSIQKVNDRLTYDSTKLADRILADSTALAHRMDTLLKHVCDSVKPCVTELINDTLKAYTTSNKIDTLLGAYATNAHLNDTLKAYTTSNKIDTLLGAYATNAHLNDTLRYYTTTNKIDTLLGAYATNSHLNDTLRYYTTSNKIDTLLGAYATNVHLNDTLSHYYDTTLMKKAIHDTANVLRGQFPVVNNGQITIKVNNQGSEEINTFGVNQANDQTILITIPEEVAVNNGQLTIIAKGDTTRFTANQAINDTVNLSGYATIALLNDTLKAYTTTNKIDTLLGAYATNSHLNDTLSQYTTTNKIDTLLGAYATNAHLNDTLKAYTTTNKIDTLLGAYATNAHLNDTLSRYTTTNKIDTLLDKHHYLTSDSAVIVTMRDSIQKVNNRLTYDSTALAHRMDTLLKHVCDSVRPCVTGWMGDTLQAYTTSNKIDTLLGAYATNAHLNDTLSRYTTTNKIDTLLDKHHYLTSDSAVIVTMRDSIQKVNNRLTYDSTALAHRMDTLLKHVCDSVRPCVTGWMGDTLQAYTTSNKIDTLLGAYATNVHLNDTLKAYTTSNKIDTLLGAYATNAHLNDTLKSYTTTNKIDTLLGAYATNAHLNDTLSRYTTTNKIDTLLGAYATNAHLNDTLGHYTTTNQIDTLLDKHHYLTSDSIVIVTMRDSIQKVNNRLTYDSTALVHRMDTLLKHVCDSVRPCVTGWMGDTLQAYTTSNKIDTLLGAYATNAHLNDTLKVYTTTNKIDTLLGAYATNAHLNDTLSRYTTTNKIDTLLDKHHYLTSDSAVIVTMRDSIQKVNTRLTYDSTALAHRMDTLLKHVCDSVRPCVTGWMGDTLQAYTTSNKIDTLLGAYATNVHLNDTLKAYTTSNKIDTLLGAYATNAHLNDTLKSYTTTNKIDTLLGAYATNAHLNDTLSRYTTTNKIDTLLGAYATNAHLNDTLGHYTTTNQIDTLLDKHHYLTSDSIVIVTMRDSIQKVNNRLTYDSTALAHRMDTLLKHVCDSVKPCVTGWMGDTLQVYTTSNKIDTLLGAYATNAHLNDTLKSYTTTNKIDTLLGAYATNAHLNDTLKAYTTTNKIDTLLGAYATNAHLNDTLKSYTTTNKIDTLLGAYATNAHLNDTLSRYTTTNKIDTLLDKHHYLTSDSAVIVMMRDSIQKVNTRLTYDSTALAHRMDTLLKHVCDSVKPCVTGWMGDTLQVYTTSNKIDTLLGAYATNAHLNDTLKAYTTTNKIDTLLDKHHYLTSDSIVIVTMRDSIQKVNNRLTYDSTALAHRMDTLLKHVCDSVRPCVTGWMGDTLQAYTTSNKIDTLLGAYATNAHLNDTLKAYTTSNKIDTLLGAYATNAHLNDTLKAYTTTNKIDTLLGAYATKVALRDSTRMVFDTLHKYYATKDTLKNYVKKTDLCKDVIACDGIQTMRDSIQKVNNRLTYDSTKLADRIHADSIALVNRIVTDSTVLAHRMDTLLKHVCDSVQPCVTSWIKDSLKLVRGKMHDDSLVLATRIYDDSTKLQANIDTVSSHIRAIIPTVSDATVTINVNTTPAGSFTLNQSSNAEVNLNNIAITNADNNFTGTNTVPRGFVIKGENATNGDNCNNIVVNACDLWAVFDSLNRKMNDILKTIDTLKHVNDSLAQEIAALKPTLTVTGPSDDQHLCGGSNTITFTASITNANAGDYTYSWTVNGAAQSSTDATMYYTPNATGGYKVICTATRSGFTPLKDSTTVNVSGGGYMPKFGICIEGRTVTVKSTESSLTTTVVWGDGAESVVTAGDSHEYANGNYTIIASSTAFGNCKLSWPITITETTASPCTVTTPHTNTSVYTNTTGGLETVVDGKIVSVKDQEGNTYFVTQIGNQCWMRTNLRTSKYNDGSTIPGGANCSSYSTTDPYHYINTSYDPSYGYFYNWSAASHKNNHNRLNLCPKGWHVPSQEEWATLFSEAGVTTSRNTGTGAVYLAGGCDWEGVKIGPSSVTPNSYENQARDKWGFTALPAGRCWLNNTTDLTFEEYGRGVYFWSSTEVDAEHAYDWYLGAEYPGVENEELDKLHGRVVRCLRNEDGSEAPFLSLTASPDDESVLICSSYPSSTSEVHTVTYTATIENDNVGDYTFEWLVDGNMQTETGTTFTRSWGEGAFTVVCVATKGNVVLKDTVSVSVTVGEVPEIEEVSTNALTVRLYLPVGINNVDSVAWGNNEGGEKVPQNASYVEHTYQTGGDYTVTAYSPEGCTLTTTVTVEGSAPASPSVTTDQPSDIGQTGAILHGTVIANGNTITAQGFEWKATENGTYTSVPASGETMTYNLTGLSASTGYTYRAFATVGAVPVYGAEVSFTTTSSEPVTFTCGTSTVKDNDYDNNIYNTVEIDGQCWTKENLRSTRYSDGTTEISGKYYPGNNSDNIGAYGYLYTWAAVMHNENSSTAVPSGVQGICPEGWHVPSKTEFQNMASNSGANHAAGKLAGGESGTWSNSEESAAPGNYNYNDRNSSGFTALPAAGYTDGGYEEFRGWAIFWTTTLDDNNTNKSYSFRMAFNSADPSFFSYPKTEAYPVRCVLNTGGGGGTTQTDPSVTTGNADPVGETTATLNATITNPDNVEITGKGFEYKRTSDASYAQVLGTGTGNSFTADLTGLDAGTEYTYHAFITTASGTMTGDEETFTTESGSVTPPTPSGATLSVTSDASSALTVCTNGTKAATYTATVTENATDVSNNYTYMWNVSGDLIKYANGNTCTVIYNKSGDYTVTCIATPKSGSTSLEPVQENVTVTESTGAVPMFGTCESGLTVSLEYWVSQNASMISWGDGAEKTSPAIGDSHVYASAGVYTITAVNNNDGCTWTKVVSVGNAHPCSVSSIGPNESGFGTMINTVTDIDNNPYQVVQIGSQCWMAQNLRTIHFANGDAITLRTGTGGTPDNNPYYCYPTDFDAYDVNTYGLYYNRWAALKGYDGTGQTSDGNPAEPIQGVCPDGWHIPSKSEWEVLVNSVKDEVDGDEYGTGKFAGGCDWDDFLGGDVYDYSVPSNYIYPFRNISGFNALPAGQYEFDWGFDVGQNTEADFWSSSFDFSIDNSSYYMYIYDQSTEHHFHSNRHDAFSVRCVRDAESGGGGTSQTDPSVTTGSASSVGETTATLSASITNPDNVTITAKGFEYKRSSDGTYTSIAGTGEGNSFTANLTGLDAGTEYTYHAFITTASGTLTGGEASFTTSSAAPATFTCGTSTVSDGDGNTYNTVLIGTGSTAQCWMAQNLKSTKYSDGTAVATSGLYNPGNDAGNVADYGYLYNWNAAMKGSTMEGAQGICPTDWHVPTEDEFFAAMLSMSGDYSNFNVLSGYYSWGGQYPEFGSFAVFWTSTKTGLFEAIYGQQMYPNSGLPSFEPEEALPVRCVRDGSDAVTPPSVTTSAASNVNPTSATLNGTVNGSSITAQGFEWKATTSSTYSQVTASGTTMTYGLSNLTANTSYKYRAFVTSVAGTKYGAEKTFTTPTKPSVSTGTADPVGETTASLNATIANPNEVEITAKGFEYKRTSDNSYTSVSGTGTGNSFTADLTGLDAGTEYTYKAFITFDNQTVYGDDETFTTTSGSVTPPTGSTSFSNLGSGKIRATVNNLDFKEVGTGTISVYYRAAFESSWHLDYESTSYNNGDSFNYDLQTPYDDDFYVKVVLNNGENTEYESGQIYPW